MTAILMTLLATSTFATTFTVDETAKEVKLNLDFGIHSSMCGMKVTKLTLITAPTAPFGTEIMGVGSIEIDADRNGGFCLTAFGPETATVTLQKGNGQLPQLEAGLYNVVVNDEELGTITVK